LVVQVKIGQKLDHPAQIYPFKGPNFGFSDQDWLNSLVFQLEICRYQVKIWGFSVKYWFFRSNLVIVKPKKNNYPNRYQSTKTAQSPFPLISTGL